MASRIGAGDARTRIPGVLYVTFNRKLGKTIVHKWPKKRPSVSPVTQAQNDTFRQAMAVTRAAIGENHVAAHELTKNIPFLPQDALMAAALGTLYERIDTADGTLWSYRLMNTQIQAMLDSIGSLKGSMLVRGDDGWYALVPGTAGQILKIDDTTLLPDWFTPTSPAGAGASGIAIPSGFSAGTDIGAFALKGLIVRPYENMDIAGIWCNQSVAASTDYHAVLAELDGASTSPSITAILADKTITAQVTNSQEWVFYEFDAPIELIAGTNYALMSGFKTGSGTATFPVGTGVPDHLRAPINGEWTMLCVLSSTTANVGDTLNTGSGLKPFLAYGCTWGKHAL